MSTASRVNKRVVIVACTYAQYREECAQLGLNPVSEAFFANREVDILGFDRIKVRFHRYARSIPEYHEIKSYLDRITYEEV